MESSSYTDNESDGDEEHRPNQLKPPDLKGHFELLILSEAGKPIYTFSKREDAVTLMPLCSTLINYAQKTQQETLVSMRTSDNLVINFTTRSPLIIIVILEVNSHVDPLILVDQVEAQIISILTAKTLRSVFEDRPTFDLKRLLYGSEKLIDSIANLSVSVTKLDWPWVQAFLAVTSSSNTNTATQQASSSTSSSSSSNQPTPSPSPSLPTRPHRVLIPIVSMPPGTRDQILNIISNTISSNSKNMVFSLLFRIVIQNDGVRGGGEEATNDITSLTNNTDNYNLDCDQESRIKEGAAVSFKLVTVCNHHNKQHKLKIADIHLIQALLDGSRAQLSSVESLWMPICLPRFNQDAFLHSYISYINGMRNCLVMFSVDRDEFSNCQKARNDIEEKLKTLYNDSSQRSKLYYQMSPLVHPILLDLQEKLINNTVTGEELAEAQQQAQIYNSKLELYHARQLQFLWYQTSKQVLLWQRSAQRTINPVLYYVTKKMLQTPIKTLWLKFAENSVFLGWHVPTFQLYAQFDNTITTNEATEVIQRITNWIKKEEDTFSIKDYR